MKDLLTEILQEAGRKGKADDDEISQAIQKMQFDMENISKGENMTAFMRHHLINIVLKDLKAFYSEKDELKCYSAPVLLTSDEPRTSVPLNKLLQLGDSQIIIVQGEPGMGKTAMTEFFYKCWLTETLDHVASLETFDFAFRVECCNIFSGDINQFYEDLLPNAAYLFPNTSSMSRHFREFNVLWIIDGFDERTPEFICLLKGLTLNFPDSHKAIITTRPFMLNELKQYLHNSIFTLSIDKMRKDNVLQIIQNMILDNEERESFEKEYNLLDIESRILLATPLNLILYIQLWLEDKTQARGSHTLNVLFVKTTKIQLRRLLERSEGRGSLPIDDLDEKISRWFYSTLCKISFINILKHKFGIIHSDDVNLLKKGASSEYLIESECLSAFLIKDERCVEEPSYYYNHPLQQFFLAYFFLNEDGGKNNNSSLHEILALPSIKWDELLSAKILEIFIKFYVEIIFEQNFNQQQTDATQDFVEKLILNVKFPSDRLWLWYVASVAANYNKGFMKYVALQSPNYQYLNLTAFSPLASSIDKFLDHFHPKVIIFSVRNEVSVLRSDLFNGILNYFKDKRIDCECFIYQGVKLCGEHPRLIRDSEMDLVNKVPINVTHFIGSMGGLLKMYNHHKTLKAVGVTIESESDLGKAMSFRRKHGSFIEIRFFLDFDFKQPFDDKNLYNFPHFKNYISEVIKSHNELIIEHAKPWEDKKPCIIGATDLINVSLRYELNASQENTTININLEPVPTKYLKHIELSDVLCHAKKWRKKWRKK